MAPMMKKEDHHQVTDLKLHVEKPEWVYPARRRPGRRGGGGGGDGDGDGDGDGKEEAEGEGEEEAMFLSNLDQVVLYPIETVYYFKVGRSEEEREGTGGVVGRLREALSLLLVPYYFMAGRLRLQRAAHRLELLCNDAGVLFAGAWSELTLEQLGDLTFANPAFGGLVLQIKHATSLADLPLTMVQVTRFKCGGFTVGFSSNHALLDGIAAGEFLANYACIARGESLRIWPKPDRTMLRARSPATVKYEHFEYVWLPGVPFSEQADPEGMYTEQDAIAAATSRGEALDDHGYRAFHVDSATLARLKEEARAGGGGVAACTAFEALAAHLWQCRTAAYDMDPLHYSSFLFAVDLRQRLHPPLPRGFAGNAVLSARARARASDLLSQPLSYAVQKVQEARALITDEYIRSAIDCLEIHKGVPLSNAGCYVSAWWKIIQLHDLDFGWGPPIHASPVVSSLVEFVLFVSDGTPHGLIVLLAMPSKFLPKFQSLFLQVPPSSPSLILPSSSPHS